MKTIHALFLLGLFVPACKGDRGPAAPTPTGDIAGKLRLFDHHASIQLSDNSGVTVSLDSTSFSTTSASDGGWRLVGVPTGIYVLKYSKAGYFVQKDFNLQFVGGGTYYVYPHTLSQIPPVVAQSLTVTVVDSTRMVRFSGTTSGSDSLPLFAYIMRSQSPFNGGSLCSFNDYVSIWITPDSVSFSDWIGPTWLYNKGTREYAVAIVGNSNAPFSYNQTTGLLEMNTPGIVFSNQVTFLDP